jgi:hypothetical protein
MSGRGTRIEVFFTMKLRKKRKKIFLDGIYWINKIYFYHPPSADRLQTLKTLKKVSSSAVALR